jgi:hypothetical protein
LKVLFIFNYYPRVSRKRLPSLADYQNTSEVLQFKGLKQKFTAFLPIQRQPKA